MMHTAYLEHLLTLFSRHLHLAVALAVALAVHLAVAVAVAVVSCPRCCYPPLLSSRALAAGAAGLARRWGLAAWGRRRGAAAAARHGVRDIDLAAARSQRVHSVWDIVFFF